MINRTPFVKLATWTALATVALAACGGDDEAAATTPAPPPSTSAATTAPTTAVPTTAAPTTTAPVTTAAPTTTVAPATTVASTAAGGGDVIAVPDDPAVDPWRRTAAEYRDQVGQRYEYVCPPGGDLLGAPIWGTEIYTDDSAVCIAAVHVGLVDPQDGGRVTIVIEEAQDEFESGTANGVSSSRYGAWPASFSFPEAPVGTGTFEVSLESWSYTLYTLGLEEGETASIACAPEGELGSVWGSGPYTGDSSICTAAVHAGVFDRADGGAVTIVAGGEVESYEASEANGVTTSEYGPYGPSFEILDTDR